MESARIQEQEADFAEFDNMRIKEQRIEFERKMLEAYDQLELDTRDDLTKAMEEVAGYAVGTIYNMILCSAEGEHGIRSGYEACGVIAADIRKMKKATKAIEKKLNEMIDGNLDPEHNIMEEATDICNYAFLEAFDALVAAAHVRRIVKDLYE